MVPDHNASAIMSEIYNSLVMTETLSLEIKSLEASVVEAENLAELSNTDAENSLLAAEEALHAATHEKALRQKAQSKLRMLQAEQTSVTSALQELEQSRSLGAVQERELRVALGKAQHASEAAARGAQALKVERQNARLQRRHFAAHRVSATLRLAVWAAAQRAFVMWASKVAAGIFDYAPTVPRHSADPAAVNNGRDEPATCTVRSVDEEAIALHRATLAARDAECFELREAVAALQGKLQLEDARTVALRGATDRAARASADLLEARRRCCELVGELASANAALQRMQAERWREDRAEEQPQPPQAQR